MQFTGSLPDFFNETALPALRLMTKQEFEDEPQMFPELFDVKSSKDSIEQFSGVTGFGAIREIGEGEDVQYDNVKQTFPKTFKHKRFGLGYKVDVTLFEDDKWGLMANLAKELGRTVHHGQETQAASVLNNAFTAGVYAGPDGKALCASDHPNPRGGATQSNLGSTAQLGVTSLQLALTAFNLQRDTSGKLVRMKVAKLIVPAQLEFVAHELLKTSLRAYTADNTIQSFKYASAGMPDPFVWRFLTNPNAWFLSAKPKDTGLIWFNRKKVYTTGTVDHDSEAAKTAMRYRVSYGFKRWQGFWGNPGA